MRRRSTLIVLAVAGTVATIAVGLTVWRSSRALQGAERQVTSEDTIPVTTAELRRVENGIEQIGAPARFHDAAWFEGKLYAAGPGGLFSDDVQYRVGDLPATCPVTS
jgi:hypothetical protein